MEPNFIYILCEGCGERLGPYKPGSFISVTHSCKVSTITPIMEYNQKVLDAANIEKVKHQTERKEQHREWRKGLKKKRHHLKGRKWE